MMKRHQQRQQRGFVALALMILLAGFVAMILTVLTRTTAQAGVGAPGAPGAYLSSAEVAVRAWYRQNAASIDSPGFAMTGPQILAAAGVMRQYGLQAAVSDELGLPCAGGVDTCVAYRTIALWLPPGSGPDTTVFDPTTGKLTPAAHVTWAAISGQSIEQAALSQSLRALGDLQTGLQSYFLTRQQDDSTGTTDTNWFRASPCGVASSALPCVDTWTAGDQTGIPALAGIDAHRFYDAWGQPIHVSNLLDSSSSATPYSMALKTVTPWGTTIEVEAVQPL
ncbi:MAG: hypothetical protein EPN65_09860 [Pandoraea sp.]|uniref:hypothetical protein n=1 Tax=Pandoraea sp. TaxID=1883445 RepID=UPI001213CC82|nr:hypothetical protein [Pandoraea sp.]TAM17715.1 MAG: hypothetical protein EPN65_09860 [Pandoraea sp.]